MANLHIEWNEPMSGEWLVRASIPDTATDEILEKVLKMEYEHVVRQHGYHVASSVRWRENAAWKVRKRAKIS